MKGYISISASTFGEKRKDNKMATVLAMKPDYSNVYEIVRQFLPGGDLDTATGAWYQFSVSYDKKKKYVYLNTKTGLYRFWICTWIDGLLVVNPHLEYECKLLTLLLKNK